MNQQELLVCKDELALAKEEVRAYFNDCVPNKMRAGFTESITIKCPELWEEVEQLKAVLNTSPRCVPSYTSSCRRYVVVSKEVIRRVCVFLLVRDLEEKINAPLSV